MKKNLNNVETKLINPMERLIFTEFTTPLPDPPPHPVVGKQYDAEFQAGTWVVNLPDDVIFVMPENGEGAWFKAKYEQFGGANGDKFDDPNEVTNLFDSIDESTDSIAVADHLMLFGIDSLLKHIASTYSDKYESETAMIDNTWLKYGSGKIPAGHNVGGAVKYLKRYLTDGYAKSYLTDDLKKAVHFLLFEIARRENEV
jgi:hypothetical protein